MSNDLSINLGYVKILGHPTFFCPDERTPCQGEINAPYTCRQKCQRGLQFQARDSASLSAEFGVSETPPQKPKYVAEDFVAIARRLAEIKSN